MNLYGPRQLIESIRTVRKNTNLIAEDIPEKHYGALACSLVPLRMRRAILKLHECDRGNLPKQSSGKHNSRSCLHGNRLVKSQLNSEAVSALIN
jgi:hypothetical protein